MPQNTDWENMSSALIWIFIPLGMSGLIWLVSRWRYVSYGFAMLVASFLSAAAIYLPLGEAFRFGPVTIEVDPTLNILGRQLSIGPEERPLLVLIYFGTWLWFGASLIAQTPNFFPALGLSFAALLSAAQAVSPFLYAALFIEIAVLIACIMLHTPETPVPKSLLRFLTFQTLGFPFILFTGWLLTGSQGEISTGPQIIQASVLISFGFGFLIGIVPFHSWVPMLSEENHPYIVSFIFYLLPLVGIVFGLRLFDSYPLLRSAPAITGVLQWSGILVIAVGGVWAAFQNHLGRMLGFVAFTDLGIGMLCASGGAGEVNPQLVSLFFVTLLPRGVALAVWSLGIVVMASTIATNDGDRYISAEDLRFRRVRGALLKAPFAAMAILLGHFSLAGFPLLASFPIRQAIFVEISQVSVGATLVILVGYLGVFIGGLRTLAVFLLDTNKSNITVGRETWIERAYLIIGMLILITAGLFPQLYVPFFAELTGMFSHLNQ